MAMAAGFRDRRKNILCERKADEKSSRVKKKDFHVCLINNGP